MATIRCFRNDDAPGIAEIWNDACTGRGAYPLRSLSTLERCIFSKPYFDPAGMFIAEHDAIPLGFAHAGFGPNENESSIDARRGVVCALAVRQSQRRRGIGTELLQAVQGYLSRQGTTDLQAGPHWPSCPFYFGMYGGSNLPGFLDSDPELASFLGRRGFQSADSTVVMQRRIDQPTTCSDPRFAMIRKRFDVKLMPKMSIGSWWQECVFGLTEPAEFRLEDRQSGMPVARSLLWEMEGYSYRWGQPSVGILDIQVRGEMRRQGMAIYLLSQIFKRLHDESYVIMEAQAPSQNSAALGLLARLGFEQVDIGKVYCRPIEQTSP